jgi:drug/metabolite transporter (DMT)-like permease
MEQNENLNWTGLLNLFVIYIVWGSTYLAIRIAVREGSGFPPFFLGSTRLTSAGIFLILLGVFQKKRWVIRKEEFARLVITGLLLWVGGMGLVTWSEQRADSGIAALMISVTPIWTAVLTALIDKELPTLKMVGALLVGFSGIAVLSFPVLSSGIQADIWSILGLLIAGFSWALGTVIQSRYPVDVSTFITAGYQQIIGGLGLFILAYLLREPSPHPSVEAWWAWGYLWLFGSILAFSSYINALRLLPTKIVMTYPYVNPVIAVFLGWLILKEDVSSWTIFGALLILLGVAGVFRERYRDSG